LGLSVGKDEGEGEDKEEGGKEVHGNGGGELLSWCYFDFS
jgi:hypothetical protein